MPRGKKKSKHVKTLPAVKAVTASAPVVAKAEKATPTRKKRKSAAEVYAILAKVAEIQAQGATLSSALKQLKIPYTNFHYWAKKQGKNGGGSDRTKSDAGAPPVNGSSKGGSKLEKMQAVMDEISVLRTGGMTLGKAVKQKGMTVNNYYYWVKRLQAKGLAIVSDGGKPGRVTVEGKAGDVTALLDAMTRNRNEREKLDAEWRELVRKLGAAK